MPHLDSRSRALIIPRAMGKLPYFVKRREKDGTVVNTICQTAEDALRKLEQLHSDSHAEAWIEDNDGNTINESMLKE